MLTTKPNEWVNVEEDAPTKLTYAPSVNPTPLTVSVPGREPTLGSLVVVITNQTGQDLELSSVTFRVLVGEPSKEGSPLTPTTAGVKVECSDTTTWSFRGPASPVTDGVADFVLAPQVGESEVLRAGESVDVEIYDFQTVPVPSTSTVAIRELLAGGEAAHSSFLVSTFPDGFYFDSVTANVRVGSALIPVAQVANGSSVTLTWNSSVVDVESQVVYYSDAARGQQTAIARILGEWTSPPLTSDTVFVVSIVSTSDGGEPLIAAQMTAVSVQDPALLASSLAAGQATIGGPLDAQAIAATGISVAGAIVATSITLSAALEAAAANVSGPIVAASARLSGPLTASTATVSGALTASNATVNGPLRANSVRADSGIATMGLDARQGPVSQFTSAQGIAAGQHVAKTDGLAFGTVGWPSSASPGCVGYARGRTAAMMVLATGGNLGAFGPRWSSWQASNANTFVLPVARDQVFVLEEWQTSGDLKQAAAPIWFYWVPLGTAPSGTQTVQRIGDAPEDLPAPPMPSEAQLRSFEAAGEPQPEPAGGSSADEVIALLEPFLSRSLDKRVKKELAAALQRL